MNKYLSCAGLWLLYCFLLGNHIQTKAQQPELEWQVKYLSAVKSLQQFDSQIIVSDSIICVPDLSSNFIFKVVQGLAQRGYEIARYSDPVTEVIRMMTSISAVDPLISTSTPDKIIPRYCLVLDSTETKAMLQDYMSVKLNRWRYLVFDDPDSLSISIIADSLVSALGLEAIQFDLADIDYQKLWHKVAVTDEPQDIHTLLALNYLAEKDWHVALTYGTYGTVSYLNTVNLKPSKLIELSKLRVDQVMEVEFSTTIDSTTNWALLLFDSTGYITRDKFDNLVMGKILGTDKKTSIYIRYVPPLPLGHNYETEVYHSFDLTPLGTDLILSNWIVSPTIPRIYQGNAWPYRIFATPEAVGKCDSQRILQFLQGLADIEEAFGFSASSVIKDVYITNEWAYNAAFIWSDRDAVVAYCKILSSVAEKDGVLARLVGRHEALHCIAYYYGLDDNKSLQALYESLLAELESRYLFRGWLVNRRGFLNEINEEKFDYQDSTASGSGGHAYTSTSEFIASFLNSVLRERWHVVLASKEDTFAETYAKCLQIFKNSMRNAKLENTNIYKLMEEKFEWIRQN